MRDKVELRQESRSRLGFESWSAFLVDLFDDAGLNQRLLSDLVDEFVSLFFEQDAPADVCFSVKKIIEPRDAPNALNQLSMLGFDQEHFINIALRLF